MNLGEMAFISGGAIIVPPRLLRALSIYPGARLHGLSYPKPGADFDSTYSLSPGKFDLLFTTVPPPNWPKLVRIIVRLRYDSQSDRPLLDVLADQGLNIVNYECTRVGFRAMTWSILASFENVAIDSYGRRNIGQRPKMSKAITLLEAAIKAACGDGFFRDDERSPSTPSLVVYPVSGLAYFHKISQSGEQNTRLFSATAQSDRIELDPAGRELLGDIRFTEPGYCFASIETHDACLRVSLLPAKDLNRFRVMTLQMTRHAPTSIGYLACVVRCLPAEVVIWRARNMSKRNEPHHEESLARLYLEDRTGALTELDWKHILEKVKVAAANKDLTVSGHVTPFQPFRVFISYRFEPADQADKIRKAIVTAGGREGFVGSALCFAQDYVGNSSTSLVADALRDCQGLLQIVTEAGTWIEAEMFGAELLKIPSIRALDSAVKLSAMTMQKDKASLRFDLRSSDAELADVFATALRSLRDKIVK